MNEECARCEKGLESENSNCDELENCNASIYDDDIEPGQNTRFMYVHMYIHWNSCLVV